MRQSTLIVASLVGAASLGWLFGLWRWGGFSQTNEAIAIVSLVMATLPWAVVVRRRTWAYQAPVSSYWRIVTYCLVALSTGAFPAGVALVNFSFPGPAQPLAGFGGSGHGVNLFALIALSIVASVATAVLAFSIQLIRDRWQPVATIIGAGFQFAQWVYLSWSQR